MKKCLVFGIGSQIGGVETFLINYIGDMQAQDKDISFEFVLFNEIPLFFKQSTLSKNKVYLVPSRTKNPIMYYTKIRKIIQDGQYDVIWYNVCTLSDITLLKLGAKYQVPCRIVHSHNSQNMGGKLVGYLHKRHRQEIDRYATDYFACSQEAGEFMFPSNMWQSQGRIIRNAIYVEKFQFNKETREKKRRELGLENNLVIGNVGRFHFQKNHEFIIDIFEQVMKKNTKAKLLLIGDGHLKSRIVKKSRMLGILDNVIFLENRTDVNELLQAMDIFLFPSLFEGFALALVEAEAAGLPCIVSDRMPKGVQIVEKVYSMSLDDSAQEWAEKVLGVNVDGDRKSSSKKMIERGYDISYNAQKMLEYFCKDL